MKEKTISLDYLTLLSDEYPTIQSVGSEIINLSAILNLPKGTEHFLSDLHGEYEAFLHVLKNASGVIKNKIDLLFGDSMSDKEKNELATLIYYPERKLYYLNQTNPLSDDWYDVTLTRLSEISRLISSKYTRSKVRKAMPKEFSYIMEELLHNHKSEINKHEYYQGIIRSVIDIGFAEELIIAFCALIRRLAIDHLHILGDIFDRGPRADIIMDELIGYHSIDMQWGNHDIEWIGAASGHTALIANVVRNSLRYNNFDVLEIGYGINTRPLANFAMEAYKDDPCQSFMPLDSHKHVIQGSDSLLAARMHKAISVIQFKLEGAIIKNHPEYNMSDRIMLENIDYDNNLLMLNGESYPLNDSHFPTVSKNDPLKLTAEEEAVIKSLKRSFLHSEKLQKHIRFMLNHGGMYKIYNGNLLFHGCIPLDDNGCLAEMKLEGETLKGRSYLDKADKYVREAYFSDDKDKDTDFLWYLWCGSLSPLYGKEKLATFESYFTNDKSLLKEEKNPYYRFNNKEKICAMILSEFSLDEKKGHIINGHVPVKTKKGESPVKANGRLYVIDGGFSKAYHSTTGISGYTLINNSYGFSITAHHSFTSLNHVIEEDFDLHSDKVMIEEFPERMRVLDTDNGKRIAERIKVLKALLEAYRKGYIREKIK